MSEKSDLNDGLDYVYSNDLTDGEIEIFEAIDKQNEETANINELTQKTQDKMSEEEEEETK